LTTGIIMACPRCQWNAKCYSAFLSGLTSYVGEIIVDYQCRFDIRNKLNGNFAFIRYWRISEVQLGNRLLIYKTCGKPMIWLGEKHCATFLLLLLYPWSQLDQLHCVLMKPTVSLWRPWPVQVEFVMAMWHWDRLFSRYLGFPLSVSFYKCSILINLSVTYAIYSSNWQHSLRLTWLKPMVKLMSIVWNK
jgi:hypothetical protein